jgi:hypothetical protein
MLDLLHYILPTQKPIDIQARTQPIVRELRELVDALGNTAVEKSTPWSTVAGLGEPLSRRCRPLAWESSDNDPGRNSDNLNYIFLTKMYVPLSGLQSGREGISSFYVKRLIYLTFFGIIPGGEQTRLSNAMQETHSDTTEETHSISPYRAHLVEQSATSGPSLGKRALNSNENS